LGSASLTTDAAGAVVSKQRTYPFGTVREQKGNSPTDFGFTGQRLPSTNTFTNPRMGSGLIRGFVSPFVDGHYFGEVREQESEGDSPTDFGFTGRRLPSTNTFTDTRMGISLIRVSLSLFVDGHYHGAVREQESAGDSPTDFGFAGQRLPSTNTFTNPRMSALQKPGKNRDFYVAPALRS